VIGERGGRTLSFEAAQRLHALYKDDWKRIIREGIAEVLNLSGEFHADDLRPLGIPADHKPVIGTVVGALVRQGKIVEVGRRRSEAPERHGAKSGVYALTELGRVKLAQHLGADQGVPETGVGSVEDSASLASAEPLQLFELDRPALGHIDPDQWAA
jgi:hypothetical protein